MPLEYKNLDATTAYTGLKNIDAKSHLPEETADRGADRRVLDSGRRGADVQLRRQESDRRGAGRPAATRGRATAYRQVRRPLQRRHRQSRRETDGPAPPGTRPIGQDRASQWPGPPRVLPGAAEEDRQFLHRRTPGQDQGFHRQEVQDRRPDRHRRLGPRAARPVPGSRTVCPGARIC